MALAAIQIDQIETGKRLREISEAQVAVLIASIGDVGLLNPVTVYSTDVGYGLVAGAHRLEACKRLGLVDIAAQVVELSEFERQIAECDENLCATSLTPSERALFTAKRKEAYEALHPETRSGQAQANGLNRAVGNDVADKLSVTFTKDTAQKTGVDERTVRRDAERGEKISDKALSALKGTTLNTGVYLDKLKTVPADQQISQVKADLAEETKRQKRKAEDRLRSVASRRRASAAVDESEAMEKWIAQGMTWWNRASQDWRDEFLTRIDTPVMDHGNFSDADVPAFVRRPS